MEGHHVSRKQWYLATALLLSGSLASFGLGQRLGHLRRQPVSHFVSHQAQAADVDGALGSRTTTTAPTVPTHHTNVQPSTKAPPAASAPAPLSSKPQQHTSTPPQPARGNGHEHGHKHGHGHGHKDDGHSKAADHTGSGQKRHHASYPQPSSSAHPTASGKQKHGGR
ncbi:MAG TPA: hypothetical protein VKT52_11365 [Ktedonobacterales bacterium]|nr:hypothetical protein [Ktedonobacterales bacterium]